MPSRCLIVFHGEGSHPLSFLLKDGFNHTFVCVDDGSFWVKFDRLVKGLLVEVQCASDYDLAGYFRGFGYTVVETEYGQDKPYTLEIANCVGLTKTIAGVRSWCFTPYQLYKRIIG